MAGLIFSFLRVLNKPGSLLLFILNKNLKILKNEVLFQ
jgi:hypothetical protein